MSLILLLVLGAAGFQLYRLYGQKAQLAAELKEKIASVNELASENKELQANIEYFSEPENLAKDLKSKLDYKRPGEKLIIIVPKKNE